MYINVRKVRWKNLLSTGNQFTEIDLKTTRTTLIVGKNGAGKSTLLEALTYGFYGKAYREANLPQLINSINGKELLVEVEFNIGKTEYVIRRGQKPKVFEVIQDGKPLTHPNLQDHLESSILKRNQKSFEQIDILGSADYTPFMKLKTEARRKFIEDILDLELFSVMNTVLKQKVSDNKDFLFEAEMAVKSHRALIEALERGIKAQQAQSDSVIKTKLDLIESAGRELHEIDVCLLTAISDRANLLPGLDGMDRTLEKIVQAKGMVGQFDIKRKKYLDEIKFYTHNDSCPTCRQAIDDAFKCSTVDDRTGKIETVDAALIKLEDQLDSLQTKLEKYKALEKKIDLLDREVVEQNAKFKAKADYIESMKREVEKLKENSDQTIDTKPLEEARQRLIELEAERDKFINERELYSVAATLLKDGGIKAKIVKQYMPVINTLINKYLTAMDCFIHFELDENFNETVRSRYRDAFTYTLFSMGERQRIDLALLFTWRDVANLRNSSSTNLLLMDETFDSSLDAEGAEDLLKIMKSLEGDTNIFVISHKGDVLLDKFDRTIKFIKEKSFSRLI